MTLALILSLACSVQAHPHPEPGSQHLLLQTQAGNAHMWELEQHLLSLSPEELADARLGARELTTSCPYNAATLVFMGAMIQEVPHDSAVRPGVDAMARVLALLELDPGAPSLYEARASIEAIGAQVEALTDADNQRIEAANQVLTLYTPDAQWPPKLSYAYWSDQLVAEGHDELATLIQMQLGNRC